MRRLIMFFLGVIMFNMSDLNAQAQTITGKISDDKGNVLPGVSVIVKGTSIGTTTNADGSFSLSVPANAKTLVLTAVGLTSQEVNMGNQTTLNLSMATATSNLQEVVVTALGITRDKRSLGYATQNIKSEEIVDKGDVNVVNVLQGKVAGVDITGASGSAGASSNINIRGITSFTGNNQPLFVVDGIPISNDVDRTGNSLQDFQPSNRALDLNINDIESINVLKGPAAAVLYGSRASSGALIITTKKGTAGKGVVKVTFSSSYSQQKMYGFPRFQNEYGAGASGLLDTLSVFSYGPKFNSTPTLSNGLLTATGQVIPYRAYPDNIKDFFETGTVYENNLNVNAGDAKQNFSFSLGNTDQKGFLPNTNFKRSNVSIKFNTALTDKISLGSSFSYANSRQLGIIQGNGTPSALFTVFGIARSFDLQYYKTHYKLPDGSNNWPLNATRDNPYFAAYEDPVTSKLSRVQGNVRLDYNVLKWLNVSYRLGVDAYTDRRKKISAIGSNAVAGGVGRVLDDLFYRSELNGDLLVTAKKNDLFIKGLNSTLLLGQNINNRIFQNAYVQGDSLSIPGYYNVANASKFDQSGETNTLRRLLGYYAQASFSYNNYLFLELTGRIDQSSTLPKNKNTYFYPGAAASFVFTDALKIPSKILSYGKVRLAYAKVGKDADPFLLDNLYVVGGYGNNVAQVTFPFGGLPGWGASSRIANNDLSPEFTSSYEAGVNFALFKNKLTVDATYFFTSSTDQIVNVGVPATTGFLTKTANIGEMTNKGLELLVTVTPVSSRKFSWDVSANYTRIRNKVVSIGNGITSFSIASGNSFGGAIATIYEGAAYGVIVGNKWQTAPDGQFLINPATGTLLGTTAGQIIADPNRDYAVGLTNTFKYKKLSFSFLWDYKQGGDIVSWGIIGYRNLGALEIQGKDRDLPRIIPGVIKTADGKYVPNNIQIPAQTYWAALGQTSGAGDLGVFDATTLRLREVSLGIDIPGALTKTKIFSSASFTLFARNLFYYAPNSPFDPEVNTQGAGNLRGLELQSAPSARSMGASLRITF